MKTRKQHRFWIYLQGLDVLSKVAIVILVTTLTYVAFLFLLKPVFIPESSPLGHTSMMGHHLMSFQSTEQSNLNIAAIVLAVIGGTTAALFFGRKVVQKEDLQELSIIKRVLSSDEKKLIGIVEEAGQITQDSLTFRLEWSRAKVSIMVTNLERLNILQRKREGKTYTVFLSKKTEVNNATK